jgi:hypothetical protein
MAATLRRGRNPSAASLRRYQFDAQSTLFSLQTNPFQTFCAVTTATKINVQFSPSAANNW